MDRGAHVVVEPGKGEFLGAGAAADGRRSFEQHDRVARAREQRGGGQAVGSGPDDHGVVGGPGHRATLGSGGVADSTPAVFPKARKRVASGFSSLRSAPPLSLRRKMTRWEETDRSRS